MRRVRVDCSKPYDVLIERGLLAKTGETIKPFLRAEKVLVATDVNVDKLYADVVCESLKRTFGEDCVRKFVLPAGEKSKTPQNYLKLVGAMADFGMKRADALVALGGGVIGDIAGFAASAYMRGIDLVQAPTTLLAMIDSAVGGKTGVDLPQGKNLLGAFHQPVVTVVDPDTLKTLDESQYLNGLGEGVKYAALNGGIMEALEKNRTDVESFIQKCVEYKAYIVRRDELEDGMRKLLNLGHTVGHAIEAESEYQIGHGIAVAEGLSVMTDAALRAGEISQNRAREIFDALKMVGIGRTYVDANRLEKFIATDKKAYGNWVYAVCVRDISAKICSMEIDKFLHYISKKDVKIQKSAISGSAQAPASKALAHRYLIGAFLAGERAHIEGGADIAATERCLAAMDDCRLYDGKYPLLHVGESGSTLRFLLPVACALGFKATFVCDGRLRERPVDGLLEAMKGHGPTFAREGCAIKVKGHPLRAGEYVVDGSVSSQYVSGLIMALPLLKGDSTLTVTGKTASASYIDLTLQTLAKFGIKIERDGNRYFIKGRQKYVAPKDMRAEGDWSSAGYLLAAGTLAGEARVEGLDMASSQGDRAIVELLRRAGADITVENGACIARKSELHGIDFDAADMPDIVPVMATALSFADGISHISSVDRLRDKESDRLRAVRELLDAFGVRTEYENDALTVYGRADHRAGEYPSAGDHRIAMSAAVAALATDGECVIRGAECMDKSYPSFLEDIAKMGAKIEEAGA